MATKINTRVDLFAEKRTAISQWQRVTVDFTAVNVDVTIPHTLDSKSVYYEVEDASQPIVLYRGVRPAQKDFIVLRSAAAGRATIRLFIGSQLDDVPSAMKVVDVPVPFVTSVTGTANQITASPTIGAVVLSLAGPHNFTTQLAGGVLFGNGTSPILTDASLVWDNSLKRLTVTGDIFVSKSSGTTTIKSENTSSGVGAFAQLFAINNVGFFSEQVAFSSGNTGTTYGLPNANLVLYDSNSTVAYGTQGNFPVIFGTNSLERMRILSGGNVGIGVTGPEAKLDVRQSVNTAATLDVHGIDSNPYIFRIFNDTYSTTTAALVSNADNSGNAFLGTPTAKTLSFGTNGATLVKIEPGGKVLIFDGGSTTAGAKLHVATGTSGTDVAEIYVSNNSNFGRGKLSFTTDNASNANDYVGLGVNGFNDALVVKHGGNVGIGQVGPTAVLHIKAGTTAASSAPIKLTSGTSMTTAEAGAIEFTTDDFFATITTGAARKAFILDNGSRLTSGKIPVATTNGRLIDLTASAAYTPTNVTTDRSYDANATSIDEIADVLGTVIADLQTKGILG